MRLPRIRGVKETKELNNGFFVQYEPGNGTRFDILVTEGTRPESWVICLLNFNRCMVASSAPHHTYINEKMALNDVDSLPLEKLFEDMFE